MVLQILFNGLVLGSIYGLVSFGYAIIYNTTRIFHVAYAAIYAAAPYFVLVFKDDMGIPLFGAVLLSIPATMALSTAIEFIVYRPLAKIGSPPSMIMISSIGVMVVIINLISIAFGSEARSLTLDISRTVQAGPLVISHNQIIQLGLCTTLLAISWVILRRSKFGLLIRGFRDNETLFSVLGRDAYRLRTLLFPLSAFYAALGSGLVSLDIGFTPFIGMPMLLNAVVALIIGGVGRFESPILGGIILGILQSLMALLFSSRWQDAITFFLLIVFLLFRPQGILGEQIRRV